MVSAGGPWTAPDRAGAITTDELAGAGTTGDSAGASARAERCRGDSGSSIRPSAGGTARRGAGTAPGTTTAASPGDAMGPAGRRWGGALDSVAALAGRGAPGVDLCTTASLAPCAPGIGEPARWRRSASRPGRGDAVVPTSGPAAAIDGATGPGASNSKPGRVRR